MSNVKSTILLGDFTASWLFPRLRSPTRFPRPAGRHGLHKRRGELGGEALHAGSTWGSGDPVMQWDFPRNDREIPSGFQILPKLFCKKPMEVPFFI